MNLSETFDGDELRRVRVDVLDMSQSELGHVLGVPVETISRWELGVLNMRHPTIVALALSAVTSHEAKKRPSPGRKAKKAG